MERRRRSRIAHVSSSWVTVVQSWLNSECDCELRRGLGDEEGSEERALELSEEPVLGLSARLLVFA